MNAGTKDLDKRKVFVHPMTYTGARTLAAALRSSGLDANVIPPSDGQTLELGGRYASGEECYPLKITLGDILKLFHGGGYKPEDVAIFMPISNGPCRFGQYVPLIEKILRENGMGKAKFIAPTCEDGYESLEGFIDDSRRPAWIGIVAADVLRKLLLLWRPYEIHSGESESLYEKYLDQICDAIAETGQESSTCLKAVEKLISQAAGAYKSLEVNRCERPLIGIVGEIFCRLNRFSNMDLIKKIEELGGEAWQSDVAEWVFYTDRDYERLLKRMGKGFSLSMLKAKAKYAFQKKVEHTLYGACGDMFRGREEPHDVEEVMDLASPYLRPEGSLGEMVLSVGKVSYYRKKGACGVIDISPFACMNGIISESIYHKLSADLKGFPVKIFYFDETQRDIEYELEIFMDIARQFMVDSAKAQEA